MFKKRNEQASRIQARLSRTLRGSCSFQGMVGWKERQSPRGLNHISNLYKFKGKPLQGLQRKQSSKIEQVTRTNIRNELQAELKILFEENQQNNKFRALPLARPNFKQAIHYLERRKARDLVNWVLLRLSQQPRDLHQAYLRKRGVVQVIWRQMQLQLQEQCRQRGALLQIVHQEYENLFEDLLLGIILNCKQKLKEHQNQVVAINQTYGNQIANLRNQITVLTKSSSEVQKFLNFLTQEARELRARNKKLTKAVKLLQRQLSDKQDQLFYTKQSHMVIQEDRKFKPKKISILKQMKNEIKIDRILPVEQLLSDYIKKQKLEVEDDDYFGQIKQLKDSFTQTPTSQFAEQSTQTPLISKKLTNAQVQCQIQVRSESVAQKSLKKRSVKKIQESKVKQQRRVVAETSDSFSREIQREDEKEKRDLKLRIQQLQRQAAKKVKRQKQNDKAQRRQVIKQQNIKSVSRIPSRPRPLQQEKRSQSSQIKTQKQNKVAHNQQRENRDEKQRQRQARQLKQSKALKVPREGREARQTHDSREQNLKSTSLYNRKAKNQSVISNISKANSDVIDLKQKTQNKQIKYGPSKVTFQSKSQEYQPPQITHFTQLQTQIPPTNFFPKIHQTDNSFSDPLSLQIDLTSPTMRQQQEAVTEQKRKSWVVSPKDMYIPADQEQFQQQSQEDQCSFDQKSLSQVSQIIQCKVQVQDKAAQTIVFKRTLDKSQLDTLTNYPPLPRQQSNKQTQTKFMKYDKHFLKNVNVRHQVIAKRMPVMDPRSSKDLALNVLPSQLRIQYETGQHITINDIQDQKIFFSISQNQKKIKDLNKKIGFLAQDQVKSENQIQLQKIMWMQESQIKFLQEQYALLKKKYISRIQQLRNDVKEIFKVKFQWKIQQTVNKLIRTRSFFKPKPLRKRVLSADERQLSEFMHVRKIGSLFFKQRTRRELIMKQQYEDLIVLLTKREQIWRDDQYSLVIQKERKGFFIQRLSQKKVKVILSQVMHQASKLIQAKRKNKFDFNYLQLVSKNITFPSLFTLLKQKISLKYPAEKSLSVLIKFINSIFHSTNPLLFVFKKIIYEDQHGQFATNRFFLVFLQMCMLLNESKYGFSLEKMMVTLRKFNNCLPSLNKLFYQGNLGRVGQSFFNFNSTNVCQLSLDLCNWFYKSVDQTQQSAMKIWNCFQLSRKDLLSLEQWKQFLAILKIGNNQALSLQIIFIRSAEYWIGNKLFITFQEFKVFINYAILRLHVSQLIDYSKSFKLSTLFSMEQALSLLSAGRYSGFKELQKRILAKQQSKQKVRQSLTIVEQGTILQTLQIKVQEMLDKNLLVFNQIVRKNNYRSQLRAAFVDP